MRARIRAVDRRRDRQSSTRLQRWASHVGSIASSLVRTILGAENGRRPKMSQRVVGIVLILVAHLLAGSVEVQALTVGSASDTEHQLNITGTKVFEMKQAEVQGDLSHFSTENLDSIPGFHLDQSMHLEMDGYIDKGAKVHAVLDDKDDEDKRFTIGITGNKWDFTLGDFPASIKDTEFTLYNKEVRGLLAVAKLHPKWRIMMLGSRTKGVSRREQFRGAGQQQEFRLLARPVVPNSERVTIDGKPLTRGTDYLIDFEDGVLKLASRMLPVEATSWIVIEYEVSDTSLAFKRNLYGARVEHFKDATRRFGLTWLREIDDSTPKPDASASTTAVMRPMDHHILEFDTDYRINDKFSLRGETSFSWLDPNATSNETEEDKTLKGLAYRFGAVGKSKKYEGELTQRRIDKDFKLVGREGATELGERGLVNDVRKETGKVTYHWRPDVDVFSSLESARTNLSGDPELSSVAFMSAGGGAVWRYRPSCQLELRANRQDDREERVVTLSDQRKTVGAMVWDHAWSKLTSQSKIEHTKYDNFANTASASRALQYVLRLGSQVSKSFVWSVAGERFMVNDEVVKTGLRSDTSNYTLDFQYNPNRLVNARTLIQWRVEEDFLANSRQNSEVADASIRYRPKQSISSTLKYKVENTTKVIRDPSLDPTKYQSLPTLPVASQTQAAVLECFENPVTKRTANIVTTWQPNKKCEGTFDWRFRDLRDRATHAEVSRNDRKLYEVKWTPNQKLRLVTDYEVGESRNLSPQSEFLETIKRVEAHHEFWRGYILSSKWEDHNEDDVLATVNSKRTRSKGADFQRVFSPMTTLEVGVNAADIDALDPRKEWTSKAAVVITPGGRNQRYRVYLSDTDISGTRPGKHQEGGVEFSQFVGTDTVIDGQIKKVKSSAGVGGAGYDGMVANAKVVITF